MEIFLICSTTFVAAGLTLFSGFGLTTILMPVIAVFFPIPIAIAVTAIVHLLNSLFKLGLLLHYVNLRVFLTFGIPAMISAIPGALLLDYFSQLEPIAQYLWINHLYIITPVKLIVGTILIVFATIELVPFFSRPFIPHLRLEIGGIVSGFLGGLSGHQGAFRSAFLVRTRLDKNAFVSTNAAISVLVDISRLVIYGLTFEYVLIHKQNMLLISLATSAAFLGVFLGTLILKKVTIKSIQKIVAMMLYLLGGLLCAGII